MTAERLTAVRPLRIAILHESAAWGGMEIHALELARVLARRGHHAMIVQIGEPVFDREGLPPEPGVELLRLPGEGTANHAGFVRWRARLRSLRADVGVFEKGWFHSGSPALELAARAAFGRYITIEQNTPPPLVDPPAPKRHFGGLLPGLGLWRYRRRLEVWLRGIAPHRVIGVNRAVADQLHRLYGFAERKLVVIPNGTDCDRFHPDEGWRNASRARWGVPGGALVFGTVGRLDTRHKGQDLALELFAEFRARRPDDVARYVLVGDGPDRARLARQAESLGLAESVIFAGATAAPWEAYPGFDVFLLPSRFEGGPFTLMEAMASGVCSIAMSVGAADDIIPDPGLGWRVPSGSRDAFLAAMETAADAGAARRQAIGERARQHVLRHFGAARQYAAAADFVLRS